jgi:hypothetical protein
MPGKRVESWMVARRCFQVEDKYAVAAVAADAEAGRESVMYFDSTP